MEARTLKNIEIVAIKSKKILEYASGNYDYVFGFYYRL
jgi:hypothetical protein